RFVEEFALASLVRSSPAVLLSSGVPNGASEPGEIHDRRRSERLIRPIDVLVVEDNPPLRQTVATALASEGYEVLSAADGVDALGVLEHTDPWLLILDIQLPRMDGRELVREIRK